ncbi:MAG: DUF2892 domain-containing protein [Desulfopila sp.]|jgi:hypothetical protein|nr:DUF2892 domain-containing protein [Desulfopila sp.]
MTVTDWIHAIAGSFILISLSFGAPASPFFHSTYWLFFTAFVGANLLQFGITKFCPMAYVLRRFGVPEHR